FNSIHLFFLFIRLLVLSETSVDIKRILISFLIRILQVFFHTGVIMYLLVFLTFDTLLFHLLRFQSHSSLVIYHQEQILSALIYIVFVRFVFLLHVDFFFLPQTVTIYIHWNIEHHCHIATQLYLLLPYLSPFPVILLQ